MSDDTLQRDPTMHFRRMMRVDASSAFAALDCSDSGFAVGESAESESCSIAVAAAAVVAAASGMLGKPAIASTQPANTDKLDSVAVVHVEPFGAELLAAVLVAVDSCGECSEKMKQNSLN